MAAAGSGGAGQRVDHRRGEGRHPGPLGRAAAVAAGARPGARRRGADGRGGLAAASHSTATGRRALRFTRGKGPPAEVLWTLTAYDEAGGAGGRPGRARPAHLAERSSSIGRDGSLELLLQADPPRAREANWLQAPGGPYALVLRLHGARERSPSLLDGSWKPPPVTRAGARH